MSSPGSPVFLDQSTMLTNLSPEVLLSERDIKILTRAIHSRDIRFVTAAVIGIPKLFDELHKIISSFPKIMMHNECSSQEPLQNGVMPSFLTNQSHLLSDEHGALDLSVQNLRKRLRPRDFYKPEEDRRAENESLQFINPVFNTVLAPQLSPPNSSSTSSNPDVQSLTADDGLMDMRPIVQMPILNFSPSANSFPTESEEQKERQNHQQQPSSPTIESEITYKKKKATKLYPFPSKRPIKCDICLKVVRADNFRVHQRSHTGEKPYRCPICPFRSANPSSMPKHLKLHDKGRMIFYCDHCTYSTIYKSNLAAHVRTHHSSADGGSTEDKESSDSRYSCIQCGMEFSSSEQKINHETMCLTSPVDFSASSLKISDLTASPDVSKHNFGSDFHIDRQYSLPSPISMTKRLVDQPSDTQQSTSLPVPL